MSHGGARNRSGPRPAEGSGRSDQRGFRLTALPAEGYRGLPPEFPLPNQSTRESQVWAEIWRTPQACAWSLPSESWRVPTVALWVRVKVRAEDLDAPASILGQLHRFADQIGLTTAGLAEMGWKVATDEVADRRPAAVETAASAPKPRRLRAVSGGEVGV